MAPNVSCFGWSCRLSVGRINIQICRMLSGAAMDSGSETKLSADVSKLLCKLQQADVKVLSEEEKKIHYRHLDACKNLKEFYVDPKTGYQVLTGYSHLKRGDCCGNECRHEMDEEMLKAKVTQLRHALRERPLASVAEILDEYNVNVVDEEGMTPLIYVIQNDSVNSIDLQEKIRLLISKGADVNLKGEKFWNDPPLHCAVAFNHLDVVDILLDAGADINIQCETKRYTPLHLAVQLRNEDIVEFLLRKGADVTIDDYALDTPLHLAADKCFHNNDPTLLKSLVRYNAPLYALDWEDFTPVMRALQTVPLQAESVKILLLAGSRCDEKVSRYIHLLQNYQGTPEVLDSVRSMIAMYAFNPRRLQDLACFRIRDLLGRSLLGAVSRLPVPESYKRQIQLQHVLGDCSSV